MKTYDKGQCEYLRLQCRQKFDKVRSNWIECGTWTLPHRTRWLLGQEEGRRLNQHIVDPSHILALRSYVAGFLEGNTSASRPWFRISHRDPDVNMVPENRQWMDVFTRLCLSTLNRSNFYHAAGGFYYDFGVFNTGAHYIDELKNGLHFHTLTPGSYYVLNNNLGVADIMVREFSLTVKALVDTYGVKDKNGMAVWDNFSSSVKKMYEDGNYTQTVDVVHIIKPNENFNPKKPIALTNKQWLSLTYEIGTATSGIYGTNTEFASSTFDPNDKQKFLKISASKRKPFICGKSDSTMNFEYGEKGPTLDALGCIKSLNKKAIGKDIALDHVLKPAVQGPASLRKSYISTSPSSYVPLDAQSMQLGGLKRVFEISPAITAIIQDVGDLRQMVERLYYSDYLLYLTRNPKTRTATETNAVIQEQQLIIGPNLQSLNWTYNIPVVEFVMDYTLDEDPYLPPPPQQLRGQFLQTEFISVFAQAQKAADLPSIEKYVQAMLNVGTIKQDALDKINTDKLADLYEDRLYLPAGLNNPQAKVQSMREQAQAMQARQQAMTETIPAMAGAAKDVGLSLAKK